MFLTGTCRHSLRSLRPFIGHAQSRSFLQTPHKWFPRVSRIASQSGTTPTPTEQALPPPNKKIPSFGEQIKRPRIGAQILFVVLGTAVLFVQESSLNMRENVFWAERTKRLTHVWPFREFSVEDIRRLKQRIGAQDIQKTINELMEKASSLQIGAQNIIRSMLQFFGQVLVDTGEGRRFCWNIIAFNLFVWSMWKIPPLRGFMHRSFTHDPLSGRSYTLLTSMFSHNSFFHLAANSMALASFGGAVAYDLQRPSSGGGDVSGVPQFFFFFISAGLFSGLVSHVVSAKIIYPRMLSRISQLATVRASSAASSLIGTAAQKPMREILPSLGASGAIYAAVTYAAYSEPDAMVRLLFIPVDIPISVGVSGLVLADIIGAFRGWRLFDHYAHLGGALFGVLYYKYGKDFWHTISKGAQLNREKEMKERSSRALRSSS